MLKQIFKPLLILLIFAGVSSCKESVIEDITEEAPGLYVTVDNPVCGDLEAQTKALDENLSFSFGEEDDLIVIHPTESTRMNYRIIPDPTNPKKASFHTEAFNLRNADYYAIYPSFRTFKAISDITVEFTGQTQTEAGSTAHLAAYDYSTAIANVQNNTGVFPLKHKVSWLKIAIKSTEAATITKVTVSADNGIPKSASLNLTYGTVSTNAKATDKLTLLLGEDSEGLPVEANGTLTAFLTISPGTYSNLFIQAEDTAGNKYIRGFSGDKTLEAGKYYTPILRRSDIPEETPFTEIDGLGLYGDTDTENPAEIYLFDEDNDQISYGTSSSARIFKAFDYEEGYYSVLTVTPSVLRVGEDYTVSANSTRTSLPSGIFRAVKNEGGIFWLEDKTNHIGYIIATE